MTAPIRIALADDMELFLESLTELIRNSGNEVEVIWSARSGEEAREKMRAQMPDVLLLDYTFHGKQVGGDICGALLGEFPDLKVLMLSVSKEVSVIRETLKKGARGYMSKEVNKAELLTGIRSVASGAYFLDQTALVEIIRFVQGGSSRSVLPGGPTPRELEVACYYAKGRTVKQIAASLFISEDTVESHIKNLRSKTDSASRFEVGEWMKRNGFWEECETRE